MTNTLILGPFSWEVDPADRVEGCRVHKACGCVVMMNLPGPVAGHIITRCAKADRIADFAMACWPVLGAGVRYSVEDRRWAAYSAHLAPTWAEGEDAESCRIVEYV